MDGRLTDQRTGITNSNRDLSKTRLIKWTDDLRTNGRTQPAQTETCLKQDYQNGRMTN